MAAGSARLSFSKGFEALLRQNAVKLQTRGKASLIAQKAVVFTVGVGRIDPTTGKGLIHLEGELLFKRQGKGVSMKHLNVKAKRDPLYAKLGGGQQKVATVEKINFARRGFDSEILAKDLKLSANTARRLDRRLHITAFAEGQLLGTLRAQAKPETTAILPKGRATLTPDPAFLAKLESLFVSLNPIAPAELAPGPVFSFPIIANGALAPDASLGTLRTGGSIEFLKLGGGQLFWHELWLDLGSRQTLAEVDIEPTPYYPGKLGQVPVLELDPGAVFAEPKARTISVSGSQLTLNAQTAAAFNEAFNKNESFRAEEVFKAGEALGSVSFTAWGQ